MIFFDITNVDSFENIAGKWLPEVIFHAGVSSELRKQSH